MLFSRILRFLKNPSIMYGDGYCIYRVGRESFVYEETDRQIRIVGTMLIGMDKVYSFELRGALQYWQTPQGTSPIRPEERRLIIHRFGKFLEVRGWTYEFDE